MFVCNDRAAEFKRSRDNIFKVMFSRRRQGDTFDVDVVNVAGDGANEGHGEAARDHEQADWRNVEDEPVLLMPEAGSLQPYELLQIVVIIVDGFQELDVLKWSNHGAI